MSTNAHESMKQAPMTVQLYLSEAIEIIDKQFGEGYAEKNPSLVGAFIQACAVDCGAMVIADHLDSIRP